MNVLTTRNESQENYLLTSSSMNHTHTRAKASSIYLSYIHVCVLSIVNRIRLRCRSDNLGLVVRRCTDGLQRGLVHRSAQRQSLPQQVENILSSLTG